MDKIVPSILFNFQDDPGMAAIKDFLNFVFLEDFDDTIDQTASMLYHSYPYDRDSNGDPHSLALQCLRELMGKASFGSLRYF